MTERARWQEPWILVLRLVPLLLLILSYAWLSIAHGTPWLWNVPVHESGHYTLAETVLFVRHHLREIPVDVAMALSIAAAIRVVSPSALWRPARWPIWCAVALVATAFAASAAQEGAGEAVRDVLQYRTRDDDVAYGSHWRFHFLSTIWFAVAAMVLAAVSSGTVRALRAKGAGRTLNGALWAYVILLTVVFGFTTEPFTSNRYIGHQAREILTHGLITLPLVFALTWRLDGVRAGTDAERSAVPVALTAWLLVVGIPIFLAVAFAGNGGGLEDSAQLSAGLAGVVAGHVFEHALDYLLVLLLTLSLTGLPRRRTA